MILCKNYQIFRQYGITLLKYVLRSMSRPRSGSAGSRTFKDYKIDATFSSVCSVFKLYVYTRIFVYYRDSSLFTSMLEMQKKCFDCELAKIRNILLIFVLQIVVGIHTLDFSRKTTNVDLSDLLQIVLQKNCEFIAQGTSSIHTIFRNFVNIVLF